MKIYGLDFTSAPGRQKPITSIEGALKDNNTLHLQRDFKIASLNEFEVFLKRRGPWIAGFDFPFGQPRPLIENLGWPTAWADYITQIAAMSQREFEEMIAAYRQTQPAGHKHLKRTTDIKAKAQSPMMLHGVPVGKMFFKGAPRLLRAGINILPCRPTHDDRIALEAYPALVARKWLNKRSYKNDSPRKQTIDQEAARRDLVAALRSEALKQRYNIALNLSDGLTHHLLQDPSGDSLDALLCAIQAAWACTQQNYGIPATCDPLEGWIVDPEMTTQSYSK